MRIPGHQKRSYTWRWTAALGGLAVVTFALVMALVVAPAMRVQAAATVTTLASRTLSADTAGLAPGSGVYTALTGPVLQEGVAGDVSGAAGTTIVLTAPVGFEFNPAATVTVSVSPATAAGLKIDDNVGCASPSASEGAIEAAGTITIYFCSVSTSPSTITWSGITVRPVGGGPFDAGPCGLATWPSGSITHTGTAAIAGAPPTYGELAESSGAAATIAVQVPLVNGLVNAVVGPMGVCVEDQFGSPAVGKPMTWSISSYPAGATCQELLAPDATTNDFGLASTLLRLGHLDGNYQVSASSGAAGPTTNVSTASGGPGAACAPPVPPTSTPTATATPSSPTPTPTRTSTPTATGTPPTATPTATPTMESVSLVVGCNPVASTYPDNTAVTTIAAAVSPSGALVSIWKFEAGIWRGYSPYYPEYSDLSEVDFLDVAFICVDTVGTFQRPEY